MKSAMFRLTGLILLFASSSAVHSQNCQWRQQGTQGPGWYDAGGGVCNNASQQSAAPSVRWMSRWGAIATSSSMGDTGTVVGQDSRREAERIALQRCGAQDGIPDCKVRLSYRDSCAAIAWGGGRIGMASAPSIEEASLKALVECYKKGRECKTYYTECSLPERIQ